MLRLDKINVNIGLIEILKDVSLDLKKGQMVGLIGRNGAGKTTLLRAIMELVLSYCDIIFTFVIGFSLVIITDSIVQLHSLK